MELGVPLDGSNSTSALEVNPDDSSQIFRWHLVRQYDAYCDGANCDASAAPQPFNVVVYKYFQDSGKAYLSDVYDTTPAATPTTTTLSSYAHHTHLNYEPRPDPTETYNSGWLIRQTQRLAGIDVTSKTFNDGSEGERRLVRRYHLAYDGLFHTSYLTNVQVEGRCEGGESGADTQVPAESNELLGATSCETLPPMTFDYSHTRGFSTAGTAIGSGLEGYEAFDQRIKQIGGDPPHSIDEELSDFFDTNSDGLPDLLVTAPGVYGNDFGVFPNSAGGLRDTFGEVQQLPVKGVLGANAGNIKLSNANVMPLDLDADGTADLVHMPKVKTYAVYRFEDGKLVGHSIDAANQQSPKIDLGKDAFETKVADVNFDGLVDLVVSTGTEFQTFLSLGRFPNGYGQFGNASWSAKDSAAISNNPIRTCVPYSGSSVQFGDSEIQLADMNGDGIQDIVRLRRGDVRYWPGRGNGFWGTGKLNDCPAGSFGDKRYLTMDSAPYYSDIQGTSLRVDDVNGDGLDDLVQVRFDGVDVWLNVDGHGWTHRYIIENTVPSPAFANRVRLTDINGSGTRDIVWGNGRKYEYMDLAGGERPGLLIQVKNGLGKSTDIEYSTSTTEMLAAEHTGVACSGDTGPFDGAWCSKMPTVTHIVSRVIESDNLQIAGFAASKYVTEYSYRDPVYEGRQREFRGFRRARSKRVGDENSPSDFTESTFLLGECEDETPSDGIEDCALTERWRDNPREALKGLPIVTERYDESGKRLSTALTTYRLRHLYSGLDGREVRHAFQSSSKSYQYDTAAAAGSAQTSTFKAVELESSYDAAFNPQARPVATPAGLDASNKVVSFKHYSTSGAATIESAAVVDYFGNQVATVDQGCTGGGGSVCTTADEIIYKYTLPKAVGPWLFRTQRTYAVGSVHTQVRGDSTTSYDAFGAPTGTTAELSGTVALDRFWPNTTNAVAPTPTTASQDGTRVLGARSYDQFGNLKQETGPTGPATGTPTDLLRCRKILYDDVDVHGYAQFPVSESVYSGGCNVGTTLMTLAGYDRGVGLVTTVTDPNDQTTTIAYDGFGRLTQLFRPGATTLPSIQISYSLPTAEHPRAYSSIHTRTQNGANLQSDSYAEAYSFIDGMGRARVGLSQGDTTAGDEEDWIVSSVADFDAKGAVRRKYLPFFLDADPSVFPLSGAPETPYGRQRYDAFGRQLQTFDIDGTVTLQSRYHALCTDLYDAADLYPGPHEGTYATTRTDGHGRTVETTERVHVGGVIEKRYVRMQYLATGEVEVITRQREDDAANAVTRWMRYDTLGRMVLNVDPHTTVNFTTNLNVDATPAATTGLKAWRYAYDDAGDLVGTSDARGCGQDFFYDGVGRLWAEDYSPCYVYQTQYSPTSITASSRSNPAVLTSTDNLEIVYQYDNATLSDADTGPVSPDYSSANLKGRLVAVHDRAASTWFSYDNLGRTTATFRRITGDNSGIGAQSPIRNRYSPTWYHKTFTYDAADRPVDETTGVASTELQADGQSKATSTYTKRGTLKSVGSSYGDIVKSVKHRADGLVGEVVYGDVANTTTSMRYDSRRRLASVQTARSGSAWSPPAASYVPAPAFGASDPPTTFQLLLQDLDYSYDVVGNPTEIRDWRTPEEWPAGAKPVSRRMEYDDLYRVTRVDYEYPGGSDKSVSPFAPEEAGVTDPRRGIPLPHSKLSSRAKWQTYKYDWLGNTSQSDDDQHVYFDRSLGAVTNGTTGTDGAKPYRFASAAPISGQSTLPYVGYSYAQNITYDAAGNLTTFRVNRASTNCLGSPACYTTFYYYWDEVGRLLQVRAPDTHAIVRYTYDANDERVMKAVADLQPSGVGPYKYTNYIFDSLEVRGTTYDTVTKDFPFNANSEVGYLSAHGVRLARFVYEPAAKGEPRSPSTNSLHVMLALPDHLGSASIVIDRATSELVEARTYQPYGATESDYRPDRWKGFREDYGFTGKEEDVEVGLQYFGKRFLSPYLGRWISPDPLAVHSPGSADLNLYAYVNGALLKDTDPQGLTQGENYLYYWWLSFSHSQHANEQERERKASIAARAVKQTVGSAVRDAVQGFVDGVILDPRNELAPSVKSPVFRAALERSNHRIDATVHAARHPGEVYEGLARAWNAPNPDERLYNRVSILTGAAMATPAVLAGGKSLTSLARLGLNVARRGGGFALLEILSTSEANAFNSIPAYEGPVARMAAKRDIKLVRVYTEGFNRPEGKWAMAAEDIEGRPQSRFKRNLLYREHRLTLLT